jgi:serine phosphatase RsbU (regulator of sigma subunit)
MFHRILTITVVFLILLDGLLLLGMGGYGPFEGFATSSRLMVSILLMVQLPTMYFIVYKAYIGPIQALNQEVAKFMTGIQEDTKIEANSLSRGMNYLINFFSKSLQILKVFKQELRDGRKLRSEVEIASEIQKHIFAKEETVIPSLEIAMGTNSASEVGGDSFDIITGKDSNYYVYVGHRTWSAEWICHDDGQRAHISILE